MPATPLPVWLPEIDRLIHYFLEPVQVLPWHDRIGVSKGIQFLNDYDGPFLASLVESAFKKEKRRKAVFNRVPSGVCSQLHTDTVEEGWDRVQRIHFPLITNGAAFMLFWEEGKLISQFLAPGMGWIVPHDKPHAVANCGALDRIHLIVDFWKEEGK